jgi:hypothetical protein
MRLLLYAIRCYASDYFMARWIGHEIAAITSKNDVAEHTAIATWTKRRLWLALTAWCAPRLRPLLLCGDVRFDD